MKKKEKRMIMILVIITIIAMIILYFQKRPKEEREGTGEEVIVQENGSKEVSSEKLEETKQIGKIEISNINVREENGMAEVTASARNTGEEETEETAVKIILKDKEGNTIGEIGAYIGKMKKGETRGIQASANIEIDNIYDIEIQTKN